MMCLNIKIHHKCFKRNLSALTPHSFVFQFNFRIEPSRRTRSYSYSTLELRPHAALVHIPIQL